MHHHDHVIGSECSLGGLAILLYGLGRLVTIATIITLVHVAGTWSMYCSTFMIDLCTIIQ